MTWKIPLFKISWDKHDIAFVNNAIRSGMNWASGPCIPQFEKEIADYIGTRHCLTFNSGTSALHAALCAYEIKCGDEVIVPSFTFIATANAPLFVNAKPVFADIERETLGLSPESVKEMISKKTRAIIPIHYGGCPCKIRELMKIAADHEILLIEDAAEAFGAEVDGRKTGSFGESGMMSFCQNKIITTGEGGAIVTDSERLYERLRLIRSHGRPETADYFSTPAIMDYISLGYNFRISNITAALGLAQLRKVEKLINLRKTGAAHYCERLRKIPECSIIQPPPNYRNVYQLFSILAENRDNLMHYLEEKGIMTKVYFPPVHQTHFYKNVLNYECKLPVTEHVAGSIISLPFYPEITGEEIDLVVDEIERFYEGCRA